MKSRLEGATYEPEGRNVKISRTTRQGHASRKPAAMDATCSHSLTRFQKVSIPASDVAPDRSRFRTNGVNYARVLEDPKRILARSQVRKAVLDIKGLTWCLSYLQICSVDHYRATGERTAEGGFLLAFFARCSMGSRGAKGKVKQRREILLGRNGSSADPYPFSRYGVLATGA